MSMYAPGGADAITLLRPGQAISLIYLDLQEKQKSISKCLSLKVSSARAASQHAGHCRSPLFSAHSSRAKETFLLAELAGKSLGLLQPASPFLWLLF
jgi:hypothetical protein